MKIEIQFGYNDRRISYTKLTDGVTVAYSDIIFFLCTVTKINQACILNVSNLHDVGAQLEQPLLRVCDEGNVLEDNGEVGGWNDEGEGLQPVCGSEVGKDVSAVLEEVVIRVVRGVGVYAECTLADDIQSQTY